MMQTLMIELTGKDSLKALHNLEKRDLIRIVNEPNLNSYSLPGEPISDEDFRNWIEYAENAPTVNLNEAKQRWSDQKRKLQKVIR
jgi:hypothetical protein